MVRASKPNVPAKTAGSIHYATEVNNVDTAIDAIIDDYVSKTDAAAQATAGAITHAGLQTFNGGVNGIPQPYSFLVKLNGADAEAYDSDGTLTYESDEERLYASKGWTNKTEK